MNLFRRIALSCVLLTGAVAAQDAPAAAGHPNLSNSPFQQRTKCTTTTDCGQGSCSQTLQVGPSEHDEGCPPSIGACHVTFTVDCPDVGCEATSSGLVCCNSSQAIQATCNGTTYSANPSNTWGTVAGGGCNTVQYSCN